MAEAADLAEKALKEENACKSAVSWRELLGETHNTDNAQRVFPLPDYCNEDGQHDREGRSGRTRGP
jgi:hypothetical protein